MESLLKIYFVYQLNEQWNWIEDVIIDHSQICHIIIYVVLAYGSIIAIATEEKDDDKQYLIYWVAYAMYFVVYAWCPEFETEFLNGKAEIFNYLMRPNFVFVLFQYPKSEEIIYVILIKKVESVFDKLRDFRSFCVKYLLVLHDHQD